MSLNSALQIGRSGLQVHQAAIEVTGNNLANAATKGYSRQRVTLAPLSETNSGHNAFIGRGVELQNISRVMDEALLSRVRSSVSDYQGSLTRQDILQQIEAIENELSGAGLNSQLSDFFNAFSELANSPADNSLRVLAVEQGSRLTSYINGLNTELNRVRKQVDGSIEDAVNNVNGILNQVESINSQILAAEASGKEAHALRDERDRLLEDLSGFVDFSNNELDTGIIDIFIGSTPIMLDGKSRGVSADFQTNGPDVTVTLEVGEDGTYLTPTSGTLGQLFASREVDVNNAIQTLETFTHQLTYEFNKVHSQGQGQTNFTQLEGTYAVADPTAALNDLNNNQLTFAPETGSFIMHVTQRSTGDRIPVQIPISLDGIGADTTFNDVVAAIDTVANVNASMTPDGRISINTASSDFEVSFSDDTSGTLAALGVNTFFTGRDPSEFAVNATLETNPQLIAAGLHHQSGANAESGDNRNALRLTNLQNQAVDAINGLSIREYWNRHVEEYAIRTAGTTREVNANAVVTESLEAQRQSLSGVNVDEEAINLLTYQRSFQGSARFISVVDQLMDTLLGLVR